MESLAKPADLANPTGDDQAVKVIYRHRNLRRTPCRACCADAVVLTGGSSQTPGRLGVKPPVHHDQYRQERLCGSDIAATSRASP